MVKDDEEMSEPKAVLANYYSGDLNKLRDWRPVTITTYDIDRLKAFFDKYRQPFVGITRENFYQKKGEIESYILNRLENFVIKDILESDRKMDTSRMPRGKRQKKEEKDISKVW